MPRMKYALMMRSIPEPASKIEAKHERIMSVLADVPGMWSFDRWPKAHDPKDEFIECVNFSKLLPKGITGEVNYSNRVELEDEASSDDWLLLLFDPNKLDYSLLAKQRLLPLIESFDAYSLQIYHSELDYLDFEKWRESDTDDRDGVFRVSQVNYFDKRLCQSAFSMTCAAMVKRLQHDVELVEQRNNGVFLVVTSRIINIDEAMAIDARIKKLLGRK